MTIVEDIGRFVAGLRPEALPAGVLAATRDQVASVLASCLLGTRSRAARAVAAARLGDGVAGDLATGAALVARAARAPAADALAALAALAMAFDDDDYLFLAHTGHSAVLASLLAGRDARASGGDVLAAIVAANEVGGRLGAACLVGPQNGQMWAFIHSIEAAVAAARLAGLDAGGTARAAAIALAAPGLTLTPGFMGPGSKVLTAAAPSELGLRAAAYAAAGLDGAADIVEGPGGLLSRFSYLPLANLVSGLGTTWVSDTLAVKPCPGCAYLTPVVACTRDLLARGVGAEAVESVAVEASLLTCAMDRMSRDGPLTPVRATFRVGPAVALTLLTGRYDEDGLSDEALVAAEPRIRDLAARVRVSHDPAASGRVLAALARALGPDRLLGPHRLPAILRGLARAASDLHETAEGAALGLGDLVAIGRASAPADRTAVRRLLRGLAVRALRVPSPAAQKLDGVDFSTLTLPFGATVRARLRDGSEVSASRPFPPGSPAAGDRAEVAREKLERALAGRPAPGRARAMTAWKRFPDVAPGELLEAVLGAGDDPG